MRIDADWLTSKGPVTVLEILQNAGFQAYFVGGCVRNALLGLGATDIDMATDALPEKVMSIAAKNGLRALPTGIEHGTVTIIVDGQTVEVTTFRKDIETDGRRAVVSFSTAIEDDARRRDFTMNALYADLEGLVIDPLGGQDDLVARKVRFIENSTDRIREDYLRILRFFRFHALYGDPDAGLDAHGLDACAQNLDGIDTLSKERIGHEMRKLLAAPDPAPTVASMVHTGVLTRVIIGANHLSLAPLIHLEGTVDVKPNWLRRLLTLGGSDVQNALRLSKKEAQLLASMKSVVSDAFNPRITGYRLGAAAGLDAMLVLHSHLGTPLPSDLDQELTLGANAKFPISAADIADRFEGPEMGACLKRLETAWIDSGLRLSKNDLLKLSHETA